MKQWNSRPIIIFTFVILLFCYFVVLRPAFAQDENFAGIKEIGTSVYPSGSMARISSSSFNVPQYQATRATIIDMAKGFAYIGTYASPGAIHKLRLSDQELISTIELPAGEDYLTSAILDSETNFGYFGTSSQPAKIIKVDLDKFIRTTSLILLDQKDLGSAIIDSKNRFAYFGTYTSPGKIIKIDLKSFTPVASLTLNSGENNLSSAVIDQEKELAYFGTYTSPGKIIKIDLKNFSRVGSLTLEPGEDNLSLAIIDSKSQLLYFGTDIKEGKLVKITPFYLNGFVRLVKTALSEESDFKSVNFYSHISGGNIRLALYDNSSPKKLIWESEDIPVIQKESWQTVLITNPIKLLPGVYWLAWQYNGQNNVLSWTKGETGDGFCLAQPYGYFSETLSGEMPSSDRWSIYFTYQKALIPTEQESQQPPSQPEEEIKEEVTLIAATQKTLEEMVRVSSQVGEKVARTSVQVGEKIGKIQEKIKENPVVQDVNKTVAPTLAVAAAANTAATAAAGASSAIPIFYWLLQTGQFLFTQPLILLTRKRKNWGYVYNSLSKEPLAMAIIRLYQIEGEKKKLIQTRITDFRGRYFFIANPGPYQIEATHSDYIFPSRFLAGLTSDGTYDNLYLGSIFSLSEKGLVNSNIPMDLKEGYILLSRSAKTLKMKFSSLISFFQAPKDEKEAEYRKILKTAKTRNFSRNFAYLAPVISSVNLFVSPSVLAALIFTFNLLLLFFFRRVAERTKAPRWGRVYDLKTRQPISGVIIRLFDEKFGKLLQTEITSNSGRYGFLVGNQKYILTAEKPDYSLPGEQILIEGMKDKIIKRDIGLIKITDN